MTVTSEVLQAKLNELWASRITHFEFDLPTKTLWVEVSIASATGTYEHELIFEEVNSIYYAGGNTDNSLSMHAWKYAKLVEIYYLDKSECEINCRLHKDKLPKHIATANFLLEIWSSELFIEARSVTIDETCYALA